MHRGIEEFCVLRATYPTNAVAIAVAHLPVSEPHWQHACAGATPVGFDQAHLNLRSVLGVQMRIRLSRHWPA